MFATGQAGVDFFKRCDEEDMGQPSVWHGSAQAVQIGFAFPDIGQDERQRTGVVERGQQPGKLVQGNGLTERIVRWTRENLGQCVEIEDRVSLQKECIAHGLGERCLANAARTVQQKYGAVTHANRPHL